MPLLGEYDAGLMIITQKKRSSRLRPQILLYLFCGNAALQCNITGNLSGV
jgi:hypothetical protein